MNTTQTVTLLAGAIHVPLALTVWSMLHRRPARLPVTLWVLGSLVMGAGAIAFAARGVLPDWATSELAAGLIAGSMLLRTVALRIDLGWPPQGAWFAGLWVLVLAVYTLCRHLLGVAAYRPVALLEIIGLISLLGWHALAAGRQLPSRSGLVLAGIEGLFAVAVAIRLLAGSMGWTPTAGMSLSWDALLMASIGVAEAVYGNLGYLGLELDRSQAAEKRAHTAQLAEGARREVAERSADELRGLLQQRDRLATERSHLLHVLAHEVRQPLHNAGGALQAATTALHSEGPEGQRQAGERLQRAQLMLAEVRSVLDNTLAVSSLLTRSAPLSRQDVDLDFIVDLALGDLPDLQRAQVQVRWQDSLRSADLEPSLVRLALRNLLKNAFRHGGPGVHVWLDISGQDEPPAVLLTITDDGPGAPASLWQRVPIPPPGADAPTMPERGLGLFIVRRVMALHGGRLTFQPAAPHGLAAQMLFPQTADIAVDVPAALAQPAQKRNKGAAKT